MWHPPLHRISRRKTDLSLNLCGPQSSAWTNRPLDETDNAMRDAEVCAKRLLRLTDLAGTNHSGSWRLTGAHRVCRTKSQRDQGHHGLCCQPRVFPDITQFETRWVSGSTASTSQCTINKRCHGQRWCRTGPPAWRTKRNIGHTHVLVAMLTKHHWTTAQSGSPPSNTPTGFARAPTDTAAAHGLRLRKQQSPSPRLGPTYLPGTSHKPIEIDATASTPPHNTQTPPTRSSMRNCDRSGNSLQAPCFPVGSPFSSEHHVQWRQCCAGARWRFFRTQHFKICCGRPTIITVPFSPHHRD